MGLGKFYMNWMRSNYQLGKRASDMMTRKMSPGKAKAIGTAVDVVAGAGLTYFFGLSTLTYIAAAATAAVGVLTAPATLPAALVTIGGAALFGGMGGLITGIGVGFLSGAKDKLNIPGPKAAIAGTGHAVGSGVRAAAKPFVWTANKLRHPFKKAHDGGDSQGPSTDFRPKPGHHQL